MRRPSRFMPAIPVHRTPWWAWLALAALVGSWALAVFTWPVPVLSVTVLAGVGLFALSAVDRKRMAALAAQRAGESICTFTRAIDARHVDRWVIRAVYEQLQAELAPAYVAFPLRPSDDLFRDLHLDPEELDLDIAPAIAQRCGRDLTGASSNPYYGKVLTVADLIRFMEAQPMGAAQQ